MLPTNIKKVGFFWCTLTAALGVLGLRGLGLVHLGEAATGFLWGFAAAFLFGSVLVSIHYLRTRGQGG